MELYIGGYCQGKLDYVKKKKNIADDTSIAMGADCEIEEVFIKPIIYQLHLLIKRMLSENENIEQFLQKLLDRNPHVIIICDEVGMGIVPFEKEDRRYREEVGRSCCFLAKRAESVERVLCKIGMKLC